MPGMDWDAMGDLKEERMRQEFEQLVISMGMALAKNR